MAFSSSERRSDSASSGVESTTSLMFSLPSDSSDVQTDITPPSSPTPIGCEGKSTTPRDILEACHRLAQLSQSTSQAEITPTKSTKQRNHRRSYLHAFTFVNDEAGYEADGDEVASSSTAGLGSTKPAHRPKFPRIDTRLRRRVANLLANRPPSGDTNEIISPTSPTVVHQTSTSLKKTLVRESHELQQRTEGEPIGLGLGLPGDHHHPLRNRAFTMPSISPTTEQGPEPSEWLPSLMSSPALAFETMTIADPHIPVALQPTLVEISPSPIDHLPPSVVCYGEPVELTPSHLAALTYVPEYSAPTAGSMDDVSVASWSELRGSRSPDDAVIERPKDASSASLSYPLK